MANLNWSNMTKNVRIAISKHSPEILTGLGIAGMAATAVIAVKATPKAMRIIEEERKLRDADNPITKVEMVKLTWKCYIPAAVTGATSAACLIGASSVHSKRTAALATAYNISRTALSEYKDKVVETIGEKKEQEIRDKVAQDKVERLPVQNNEVINTEKGSVLCCDLAFGRYFRSDWDSIQRAANRVNRMIVTNMYASLNDFYEELGLPPTDMGYELGWNIDDREIIVERSSIIASDGTPCLAISYNVAPRYEYSKFF